jgi:hypothetical protein
MVWPDVKHLLSVMDVQCQCVFTRALLPSATFSLKWGTCVRYLDFGRISSASDQFEVQVSICTRLGLELVLILQNMTTLLLTRCINCVVACIASEYRRLSQWYHRTYGTPKLTIPPLPSWLS